MKFCLEKSCSVPVNAAVGRAASGGGGGGGEREIKVGEEEFVENGVEGGRSWLLVFE